MQSKAKTVAEYLDELPADRRAVIEVVRAVILKNLDKGFQESMQYGGIGYNVPHTLYPPGYHCDPKQPLPFGGLASQKNHMAVYLMSVYGGDEAWFRQAWGKTGKKLDMGKCCVRFKKLEDVALEVIGEAVKRVSAKAYVEKYEATLAENGTKHPGKPKGGLGDAAAHAKMAKGGKAAAKKSVTKKAAGKKTKKSGGVRAKAK
jgi:Domain of unknown function (DU1801)